jgi:D-alanyl-D-alanine carboxypeptidase
MRYWTAWGLALAVVIGIPSSARADAVDDFVRAEMQRQRIPGMAVAIIKDGVVIKTAGYGYADVERNIQSTPDTVYKIGSLTKQFIAAGIMRLVEQGRLSLETPVSDVISAAPASWKPITIRHLLTHTSGLKRDVGDGSEYVVGKSDAEIVASAFPLPLEFTPGAKSEYSNLGFIVLGQVISRVTGRPWNDYLTTAVLEPAGLTRTTIYTTANDAKARGYSDNDRWTPAIEWKSAPASGALQSSVADLARWDVVLNGSLVLSDRSRSEMWTPVRLTDGATFPYGFGWQLQPLNGRRAVHHNGGLPGFIGRWWRFVDERLSVIMLMNLDDADPAHILNGIAALYLPAK